MCIRDRCSFAVPNEEFATAFRILKFFFIAMCAWLGFFGFLMALLAVLIHLSHLKSFGIPYLMPFVGADVTDYQDERDSLPVSYTHLATLLMYEAARQRR